MNPTIVNLYTSDGNFVEQVFIMPFPTPPKAIVWGVRFFIRVNDERYDEAFCAAGFTREEWNEAWSEGKQVPV